MLGQSERIARAAQLAMRAGHARGLSFRPFVKSNTPPDPLEQSASQEANKRAAVRAIALASEGGFPEFGKRYLKIKDTGGRIVPFHLNDAQVELHRIVREQEERQGYVRIVVLKARQLGISTYIAGRGYYKIARRTGQSGLIVAHENKASSNLHAMVRTFHDFMPAHIRPHAARSSKAELAFSQLRSQMTIATAKNVEGGRSFTHQFFHGSEVAFWPNAGGIMQGVMQGIHSVAGTDSWFESTAKGPTGQFYTACQAARKGEFGDYAFCFLPWFIDPARRRTPQPGFEDSLTSDDREYQVLHELDLPQMAWRATKIAEFRYLMNLDDEEARIVFGQEYPAVPEDAFNAADQHSFIGVAPVVRARRAMRTGAVTWETQEQAGHPRVMGVDPSWIGNDRFTVWLRQGRIAKRLDKWKSLDIVRSTNRLVKLMIEHRPDYVCVDATGVGAGVYDLLVAQLEAANSASLNIPGVVYCVMAGATAEEDERFVLVRDECYGRMKDWLTHQPQVALEDDDSIQADLTNVRNVGDVHRRVRLESKTDMRKASRGSLPSPDDGDGLSNTFFLRATGQTVGRTGVRAGGTPNPHRRFSYKFGGSRR